MNEINNFETDADKPIFDFQIYRDIIQWNLVEKRRLNGEVKNTLTKIPV